MWKWNGKWKSTQTFVTSRIPLTSFAGAWLKRVVTHRSADRHAKLLPRRRESLSSHATPLPRGI
eukprot:2036104-Amphidinium_carterae.1